jgi:hypothetical protein
MASVVSVPCRPAPAGTYKGGGWTGVFGDLEQLSAGQANAARKPTPNPSPGFFRFPPRDAIPNPPMISVAFLALVLVVPGSTSRLLRGGVGCHMLLLGVLYPDAGVSRLPSSIGPCGSRSSEGAAPLFRRARSLASAPASSMRPAGRHWYLRPLPTGARFAYAGFGQSTFAAESAGDAPSVGSRFLRHWGVVVRDGGFPFFREH